MYRPFSTCVACYSERFDDHISYQIFATLLRVGEMKGMMS